MRPWMLVAGLVVLAGYIFIFISILNPPNCDELVQSIQNQLVSARAQLARAQSNPSPVVDSAAIQRSVEVTKENMQLKVKLDNALQQVDTLRRDAEVLKQLPDPPAVAASVVVAPAQQQQPSQHPQHQQQIIPGVIILGMHRSGTSVVGGLVNKMGLNTGSPLIAPAEDNAKGFFERVDVVLQNDMFMKLQNIHYAGNTHRYDSKAALKAALTEPNIFKEGVRGLSFLNDGSNYPWMLKDPRLCITLRTWLPLLNFIPAILFMFRHPMDVALSLHRREGYPMGRGLRMWYVYNRRGIENSADMCRVIGSHRQFMATTAAELDRIHDELRDHCNVPVPNKVSPTDLKTFVDPSLQHGKTGSIDSTCTMTETEILSERGGPNGDGIRPQPSVWATSDPAHLKVYRAAMRAYCAMEDRTAFRHDFKWDEDITDS